MDSLVAAVLLLLSARCAAGKNLTCILSQIWRYAVQKERFKNVMKRITNVPSPKRDRWMPVSKVSRNLAAIRNRKVKRKIYRKGLIDVLM